MDIKYLKTGEAVDEAINYYGYSTMELAGKLYYMEDRLTAKRKLHNRIKTWLKNAMMEIPYEKNVSVWDYYVIDGNKKKSDRLIPDFYIQRWYMQIDRERFVKLIGRIEKLPEPLKRTAESYKQKEELLERSEYDKVFEIGVENDISPTSDLAAEDMKLSEQAARKNIEKQKKELLWPWLWEKYVSENGIIFGEEQEEKYIREFYEIEELIRREDYGIMYQELDDRLSDIQNYFKYIKKRK
jgi:hypothetical protein